MFNQYEKQRFGGPIMKIEEDNIDFIILEKDGNLYKNPINFNEKMDFTVDEVSKYEEINDAIGNQKIEIIKKYFNDITENNTLNENINENITKIKKINKLESNFKNSKPQKLKTLYCKNYNSDSLEIKKLIQLYSMVLWYEISLEGEYPSEEIFNYYNDDDDCIV